MEDLIGAVHLKLDDEAIRRLDHASLPKLLDETVPTADDDSVVLIKE